MRSGIVVLATVTALICSMPAAADWPRSRGDFSLLPPYCAARLAGRLEWVSKSQYKLWKQRLGPDFIHVHHYCAGLFTYLLAQREPTAGGRSRKLKNALSEMEYVRARAKVEFVLLPEIYAKMGKIHLELSDYSNAVSKLKTAIRLKPDYSYPYALLFDTYEAMGDVERAVHILQEGLKKIPNSKMLKKRKKRLETR